MNQMLKPSETISEVLVHHSPNNSTTNRAKTQAGQYDPFALLHHNPACTPCHEYDPAGKFILVNSKVYFFSIPAVDNYQTSLHGSAISNANVLDDVIKGKAENDVLDQCQRSHNNTEREPMDKPHCSRYDNINNAKQHSCHDRLDHHASTNEGRNEEMQGMTASALQ